MNFLISRSNLFRDVKNYALPSENFSVLASFIVLTFFSPSD